MTRCNTGPRALLARLAHLLSRHTAPDITQTPQERARRELLAWPARYETLALERGEDAAEESLYAALRLDSRNGHYSPVGIASFFLLLGEDASDIVIALEPQITGDGLITHQGRFLAASELAAKRLIDAEFAQQATSHTDAYDGPERDDDEDELFAVDVVEECDSSCAHDLDLDLEIYYAAARDNEERN